MRTESKSGWRKVTLGDIATEITKRVPSPADSGLLRFVGSACIDQFDRNVKRWDSTDNVSSAAKEFQSGDYLLVRRSLYGSDFRERAPRADFAGTCSADIIVIREKPSEIADGFLQVLLYREDLWRFIVANSIGSITRRIKWKQIAGFEFLLPPIEEQLRTVQLQSAVDRLDATIQLAGTAAKELKDSITRATFHELGPEWRLSTLGEEANLTIGRTPPRREKKYWTKDLQYPFCTIADMTGPLIEPKKEGITEAAIKEGKAKRVPAGSLLMSFKLTIGRLGFSATDLFPNEAIVWIDPSEGILPQYLKIWLEHQNLEALVGRAVKGKTLNGPALRSIPVAVPPLDVQAEIVRKISNIESLVTSTEQYLAQLSELRASLRATAEESDHV